MHRRQLLTARVGGDVAARLMRLLSGDGMIIIKHADQMPCASVIRSSVTGSDVMEDGWQARVEAALLNNRQLSLPAAPMAAQPAAERRPQ